MGRELPKDIDQEICDIFNQPPQITHYLCNWSKKYKYVYVETPKVACTTIKRVLQQAESGGAMTYDDPSFIHERERSPLLGPWSDRRAFVEAMRADDYFRFCFVRNPFSRILSCYLDKMVETEFERRRLAGQLGFDPETPPSFINFLRAISERKDEENDIHWAPQTFLLRPNRVRYSFIGRFELFRDQFSLVCERLGIIEYASDLPDTQHKTNAHEHIKEYMGREEIELVHRIYERDFRNFGFGWSPEVI
ncbi:MAG TPA: sulfotransferase family protein [Bellilinea sp.]|nr:sulfotransferase family protein [Bellilinea sp.]